MSLGLCLLSWLLVYLSAWFRATLYDVHAQSSSAAANPLSSSVGSVNSAASIIKVPDTASEVALSKTPGSASGMCSTSSKLRPKLVLLMLVLKFKNHVPIVRSLSKPLQSD